MLYVHKKSSAPIDPWPAVRHGGLNDLVIGQDDVAARAGKYLVLWNVDIVQRDGAWHYVFEFDVRNSLEVSALGQLAGNVRAYPNDMHWREWLGPGATVISAAVRQEILDMPPDEAQTGAVITDLRAMPNARPVPGRGPGDWYQPQYPQNFYFVK